MYSVYMYVLTITLFIIIIQEPDEFSEVLQDSIDTQTAEVIHKTAQCKAALLEIISAVNSIEQQLQKTLEDHSNAMYKSIDYVKLPKAITSPQKSKATRISDSHSNEYSVQRDGFLCGDSMQQVLGRFSLLLQRSVREMVYSSSTVIYNTLTIHPINDTTVDSDLYDIHTGDSSNGVKLQARMLFAIPGVVLVPSVADVYDIVSGLMASIADLLHQIQSWAPCEDEEEVEKEEEKIEEIVDQIHKMQTALKLHFDCKI